MKNNTARVIVDVWNERNRQRRQEGWTPEHDDRHAAGILSAAAVSYALAAIEKLHPGASRHARKDGPDWWPFSRDWRKPTVPRRDLVKAAALILAEIERGDRLGDWPD
jgi:hypothetical protein